MKTILLTAILLAVMLTGFAQQNNSLGTEESKALLYMREEEKLARDVYNFLYDKWGINPFGNIRESEQVHMNRVKTLLTTYGIDDPVARNNDKPGVFENAFLQQSYNELIAQGSKSLTDALRAGAKIEELDIADLEKRISISTKDDVLSTFRYLKEASGNHLRAFVRRLEMQGVSYEPVMLDKSAFDKIIAAKGKQGGRKGMGRMQQQNCCRF